MMSGQRSFTIAVMQPYFIPYAGYFRLFLASDLFVIYDCVQFPRRGWVHRNRLVDARGMNRWLTLPLAKAPRDVLIRDLRFSPKAREVLAERLRPFHVATEDRDVQEILATLRDVSGSPVSYLERLLEQVLRYLALPWRVMRSSALGIPAALRGQDRILEIARLLGATHYVNTPGGTGLYNVEAFAAAGIQLHFLAPYPGPSCSILSRIVAEDPEELADDIRMTTQYIPSEALAASKVDLKC
jgi:WbqC-like protein family